VVTYVAGKASGSQKMCAAYSQAKQEK